MRAAVVRSFEQPPRCEEFDVPVPQGPDEMLVDVIASGLHPRVRSQAAGSHYTSTEELPLVPGIDGVGRGPDGELRYFVLPDTTMGAMAEKTVIDERRSIVLPDECDPIRISAAMNPAMSSWVALRKRIDFEPGQSVLVMGATGNAGQIAIQIAKHLGASHVIGAGRDPERLAVLDALGADATVSLAGDQEDVFEQLGDQAADVDVVLDYLWGETTAVAMRAILVNRTDRSSPITWIEVGAITSPTASLPAEALRGARLSIVGSGQGSVPTRDLLADLPELAYQISRESFQVSAEAIPLSDVERAWKDTSSQRRIVIAP